MGRIREYGACVLEARRVRLYGLDVRNTGTLTTRPLKFSGKYLFANTDCDQGELRVEVLDEGWQRR